MPQTPTPGWADLPRPVDDGACRHLPHRALPSLRLNSTSGNDIDLSQLPKTIVLFCYPHTGRPDVPTPEGWDHIPGARGCTPQSCAFRDHYSELVNLGVAVFGLSADDTEWQREAVDRLHLPFELLSDSQFAFTRALRLPTFTFQDRRYIKRLTIVIRKGRIETVFYPIFPPDRNPADVIAYLRAHPSGG